MRTHTLLTKIASLAVCFGVVLSGPVMAGGNGIIKDVELTKDGVLYGQVHTAKGKVVPNAVVQLRYKGQAVAAAKSNERGQFAVSGVRPGAHELVVGPLRSPVRLWNAGTAPRSAKNSAVLAVDETIIRGQDVYCDDNCPPPSSGFGLLDVVTLATMGSAVGALVIGIDNSNKLDDIEAAIVPASP